MATVPAIIPTVRTVTAFVNFQGKDFVKSSKSKDSVVETKLAHAVTLLRAVEKELRAQGYTVQTARVATNPFGEWLLTDDDEDAINNDTTTESPAKKTKQENLSRLDRLDKLLARHLIDFCAVGPATNRLEIQYCPAIVSKSHRFSCSATVDAGDVEAAATAADTILAIAQLNSGDHVQGGLGNFRFCAAASCQPFIPFFPAAKSSSSSNANNAETHKVSFAIGLENGRLAGQLLKECQSIRDIQTTFKTKLAASLAPISKIATIVAEQQSAAFLGIDSSLNPSLDEDGSVAAAMEKLEVVKVFGGPGTLGAAAEITKALQSLPGISLTGYCGLMLPVCEDTRLAKLATGESRVLRITDLLSISSVCGVGIDTVPVPGDCSREELTSLILDVAGIAGRWNKSLSCRVFPVPGKKAGEMTDFDSPYMVNSSIFSIS